MSLNSYMRSKPSMKPTLIEGIKHFYTISEFKVSRIKLTASFIFGLLYF